MTGPESYSFVYRMYTFKCGFIGYIQQVRGSDIICNWIIKPKVL